MAKLSHGCARLPLMDQLDSRRVQHDPCISARWWTRLAIGLMALEWQFWPRDANCIPDWLRIWSRIDGARALSVIQWQLRERDVVVPDRNFPARGRSFFLSR